MVNLPLIPVISTADYKTVTNTSQQFTSIIAMAAGQFYVFTSTTACWIKQATNPTASAAAGSLFVPANTPTIIDGTNGIKLAVIRDAADGAASLARLRV